MLAMQSTPDRSFGLLAKLYCLWAILAIGLSLSIAGLKPESITRILVIIFLLIQIPLREKLTRTFPQFPPQWRFILLGTLLAAVVEGFHMISKPVFENIKITRSTPLMQGLIFYGVDLIFTVPAYLVIFSVLWYFINRYHYSVWRYIFVMGMAQALGDGGLFFFIVAPPMLFFIPYPMTNYHAINVIPFLATYDDLNQKRIKTRASYLAILGIIFTYLFCGSLIKIVGKLFGYF